MLSPQAAVVWMVAALGEKSEATNCVPSTAAFIEIEKWHLQSHIFSISQCFKCTQRSISGDDYWSNSNFITLLLSYLITIVVIQ